MNPDIHGLWPALLMPVSADGALDSGRAVAHAKHLLAAGCDGVTLFGTTGEGPAFTVAERKALLETMVDAGVQSHQIIVTTTALALGDAIELGQHAAAWGVHRHMFMPPFYFNQPHDAGVIEAISQVVRGVGDKALKLLLYHFPAMSTYGFSHAAIAELLRRHPGQVVGLKDSSGDLQHALALTQAFPDLSILVGSEQHVAPVMNAGGSGSINGLANVAPHLMTRIVRAPKQVSAADERCLTDLLALLNLRPGMQFVSVYKHLLSLQTGDPVWRHVRAPLCPLDEVQAQAVQQAYLALGPTLDSI